MVTLKQLIRLIPYYQDYKIQYHNDITSEYICIKDSSYTDTDHIEFMKKYGEWPVISVEAGKAEILYICIKERSAK